MIAEALLAAARDRLTGLRVERAVIGSAYSGVLLSDGSVGLAATLLEPGCCRTHPRAGDLAGQPAWELARGLLSPHPLASVLGLATVNAALNRGGDASPDPVEALGISPGERVGMVGYIGPLAGELKKLAGELVVFERSPARAEGLLPDWAVETELPRCDVVILSGTTFINKTVDRLLGLARGKIAVVGPSTPLWEGLFELGIDGLFGARVDDPDRVLLTLSEGGGTKALYRNGLRKVALLKGTP